MKTAILAIFLFCALIFPHELGHFIVAKLCKVQVNEFALGMGPAIFKKQRGETLYSLRVFPLGGYCSMEGENEESENPRAFNNKKAWQKILVLVAGSFMNVLLCVLIMIIINLSIGSPTTTIEMIDENLPAYGVLEEGDRIVAVNNEKINQWSEFSACLNTIQEDGNKPFNITVERDGKELDFTLQQKYLEEEGRSVIGVQAKLQHSLGTSIKQGVNATGTMAVQMYSAIKMIISGEAGVKDLSGPVGIITVVSKTSDYGLTYFFYLMAFISLNLAFVNMLPLPALDGGRIIFVIIRKITGKMISDDLEGTIHAVGLILLLGLMVFVTWNDVARLF